MIKQRTLKQPTHLSGIGLHSGKTVNLALYPAPVNTGIIFRRIDLQPIVEIPATTEFVGDTRLNSCLKYSTASVATVEHVLSALAGLQIDNAYVDLDAAEPPAMDGSSYDFAQLILQAGIVQQNEPKKFIQIKRKITVADGDKFVSLAPYDGLKFSLTIVYDHPFVSQTPQTVTIDLAKVSYVDEVSRARTFGFLAEYEFLRKNNLGLGASLENTLALDDNGLLNTDGLRYEDEFVKHKLLDAIGDLYLLGHSVIGEFTGYKSGHTLNHQLRLALLQDTSAWKWTTRSEIASYAT